MKNFNLIEETISDESVLNLSNIPQLYQPK